MTVIQGIILGLVQGIAEFLPISSSGHLQLVQHLFNLGDVPLLFDVLLHVATLCAVVLFFRAKIWELLCAFCRLIARRPVPLQRRDSDGTPIIMSEAEASACEQDRRRYIVALVLTTLVTGLIGIFVEKKLGGMPIQVICAGFIVTALFLLLSAWIDSRRTAVYAESAETAPSWWQALIIGLAQGVGTLPGISRSGSTIAGSLVCGVTRKVAGEFSFIASIPAILGAFVLEVKDIASIGTTVGILPIIVGCVVAFVSGYLALLCLMRLIRRGKLAWFACYLIPVGIAGILFL